jgi:hypothetical protein
MCGSGDPPPGGGDPPPGGGDPPPGGGDPPPGGGTPPPVPPIEVPALTTTFKPSRTGTVRMTLTTVPDGDARIELLAKKSSLRAAATTTRVGLYRRKTVKGVPTSLTLKLKGKAKRVLRKKGRLKITVKTTFTPAGGGTKLVKSKSVVFKRPKR